MNSYSIYYIELFYNNNKIYVEERVSVLKKIIFYVVSAGVGTFVCNVLENIAINEWLARGIGCVFAVLAAIFLYNVWMKKGDCTD